MIEGLEEESKSTAAKRCARIYAECNKKPGKMHYAGCNLYKERKLRDSRKRNKH